MLQDSLTRAIRFQISAALKLKHCALVSPSQWSDWTGSADCGGPRFRGEHLPEGGNLGPLE